MDEVLERPDSGAPVLLRRLSVSVQPYHWLKHVGGVNEILPWALGDVDLGDDVLEVGPGYGATTDVLSESVRKLTAVEIDAELATTLRDRFANLDSVTIVEGDAAALEFADGRFSGAASFTMLHHVPTAALQDRLCGSGPSLMADHIAAG